MKKFFEKHDLVKLVGIFILIAAILTWCIGSSYYSNGTLATEELSRVGIFDMPYYAQLGFYYFTVVFLFILVVGGFYKFIGSIAAYDKLTSNIASFFKGKEKVLVAISTLVFAAFAGVTTEPLVALAFIPFIISILAKLKVDKVSALASTFGGTLVGMLGATYSTKIVGQLTNEASGIAVKYGYELVGLIILFAVAYILLTFFTINRMNKKANGAEYEEVVDPFITVVEAKKTKKAKKVSTIPLVMILVVTFIILILAFIGWDTAFGVTAFTDLHTWISEATLFNHAIYSYILGTTIQAFGSWDLLTAGALLVIMSLIIKLVYHVSLDKLFDGYGEGFKAISHTVGVMIAVYLVLEITVIFPTIPFLIDKIMSMGTNIGTMMISGILTSIFTVDFQYTVSMAAGGFASFENTNVVALILQSAYGLVQFIAPTSAILMCGLSLLDIKFKDYFKFIWKFMLALLVAVIAVICIVMYV